MSLLTTKRCYHLRFCNCSYKSEFINAGGTADDIESYKAQALMKKIKEKYGESVSVSLYDHRKGNFTHNSTMSDAEARLRVQDDVETHLVLAAALHIRGKIQAMARTITPTPTSVETLKSSSPDLRTEVLLFFKTLRLVFASLLVSKTSKL